MLKKIRYANLSLLNKVLLPYILLLLTLAMATSFGSSMLLHGGLIDISQQRLRHIQQQAYADFKNIERLLTLNAQLTGNTPEVSVTETEQALQPYDKHITVTLTNLNDPDLSEPQRNLLNKSQANGTDYITVLNDPQQGQVLAAAQQLTENFFLVLKHPLGPQHLDVLANHYKADFILLTKTGELLAHNQGAGNFIPSLNEKILTRVLAGQPYSETIAGQDTRLVSYTALPLGHDAIYLLATAQSLSNIESLITNHRLYLLGIIGLSLLICITLFRSLLIRLFNPLTALMSAYNKVRKGDDDYRIEIEKNNSSQLIKLCHGCNQLLDRLGSKRQKIEELSQQVVKLEELKTHNEHLRKTNLELETRAVSLKEQNQKFSALFKVTQTMVSSLDQQLLYERIIQALRDSLNCSVCVLYIFQSASDRLIAVKVQGLYGVDLKSVSVELGEEQAGTAAINQKLIYIPDLSVVPNKPCYTNEKIDEGSMLSVPLAVQNRLIGVLNLHQSEVNGFSNTSQQIALAIANQAAIAIENARLYEKTKTLSATDELTGLSNRRQFQEYLLRELAQSRRQHNPFSILMIDIDHFKRYNDYHGHLKGDIVLKKVASLLVQNTRGVDLVARFGGEEFVLLLPKSDKQSSLSVAEKLRMCIEKEFFPGANQSQPGQRLTISIGISHFPSDSSDIYDLMNLADTALYAAKKQGRNTCVGWSSDLQPADH